MAIVEETADAIAEVYARSLLELANEGGVTDPVYDEFAALLDYMDRDEQFAGFMVSSAVDDDDRRESLERIFRGRMNDLLLNTLQVLNNKGRPELVRRVFRQFQLQLEAQRGQIEVQVRTAIELDDALRARLRQELATELGREVILCETVDPDVIGGLVVQVDDIQGDGSLASHLRRIRETLRERARREIHSPTVAVD